MLIESKSNLARLMATENIFIEQKKVNTAYFDLENRILTIPVLNGNLSSELYDLLLGHEVGHALETPAAGWHNSVIDLKINRTILNVCEDARIEKKIKRKFPGIRISFIKGYRELMEMDFFGVKNTNLNDLNFIDRINLYTKGGSAQGIEFLPEEQELLSEVEETETFEDVMAVAKKIQEFMKDELKKTITSTMVQVPSDEEGEGDEYEEIEGDEDNFSMNSDTEESEDDDDSGTNMVKKIKGNPSDSNKKEKQSSVNTLGRQSSLGTSEDAISSKTDKTFRQKEKELHSKERGFAYGNIPVLDKDRLIIDYKKLNKTLHEFYSAIGIHLDSAKMLQEYNAYKNESNKVVSYLVKEFELRKNATQLSRAKVSKSGELDLKQIHNYNFTDDIFKRITTIPNGKSHGLVMFIDWSGSMNDYLNSTVKQLLNLVFFCKKLNIPFEVYAFSTNLLNGDSSVVVSPCMNKEQKVGDIFVGNFSLLNLFSSRMKTKEFTEMASFILHFSRAPSVVPSPHILHLSGTPLNEAIISSFDIVGDFKKSTKVQIVNTIFLTDGEGHDLYGKIDSASGDISQFQSWKNHIAFRDPVTKSSCQINFELNSSTGQTVALLNLLKQRVGGNVIGFYIANSRDARSAVMTYSPATYEKDIINFRKNKFVGIKNSGYDEYFILRSDKLDTEDDTEFEVKNMTTRALVNAFSKYTTNRVANRLVLNRFINLIS